MEDAGDEHTEGKKQDGVMGNGGRNTYALRGGGGKDKGKLEGKT